MTTFPGTKLRERAGTPTGRERESAFVGSSCPSRAEGVVRCFRSGQGRALPRRAADGPGGLRGTLLPLGASQRGRRRAESLPHPAGEGLGRREAEAERDDGNG